MTPPDALTDFYHEIVPDDTWERAVIATSILIAPSTVSQTDPESTLQRISAMAPLIYVLMHNPDRYGPSFLRYEPEDRQELP